MKKIYLLAVAIILLLTFVLYKTYAMFTQDVSIGQIVNLTASNLSATESSVLEYDRVTIEAGEIKEIELNITNSTSSSLYYGVWYEMIDPTTINSNITIAKLDVSANPIIGQLTANQTKKVTLYLENNTSDIVLINLGVGYSSTSSLNLPTGRTIITAEATEGIDGNALPQPFTQNFTYQANAQSYTIPYTGSYKLEVWGAEGGPGATYTTGGGKGGYSYGTVTLNQGTTIYVYTGGQGTASATSSTTKSGAGFNANAANVTNGATGANGAGGGGGASDIRIGTNNINYRIIVAGGGGGKCGQATETYCSGGYGGGTTGGAGQYQTSTAANTQYAGQGGTATAGGATGTNGNYKGQAGSFGSGGYGGVRSTSYRGSGAGGGGWYGGGGGAYRYAGGGGGSGYVWTSATASSKPSSYLLSTSYYMSSAATVAGNTSFKSPTGSNETGHSGNGYARLTFSVTYPTMTGLTNISISAGSSYNLTNGVTCVNNGTGCTILKVSIPDTSVLSAGTYTVKYIVKNNSNTRYKFTRTLTVT